MPPSVHWSSRKTQDQRPLVDPQNPPKHPAHRGSMPGHEGRLLVRRNYGNDGTGERTGVDGRSQHRNNPTLPDNGHLHHDHRPRPQDGQTALMPVGTNESWGWGQSLVNTSWRPGLTQVEVRGQWVFHDGQPREGHGHGGHHGRGHRSSDTRRPPPAPEHPPRRVSAPFPADPLPVIPRTTPSGGMGLRNLLRRNPRHRSKILFYNKNEPHYGFTNFSSHAVMYGGKRYPTSEHLFQSLKFAHKPNLMEHIRTCNSRPSVAFAEARRYAHEIHPNWKHENIKAMDTVLYHKFTQHHDLKRELLATGDAELIENSDKDSFWGCGADGKGRNELGKALERLRKRLREQ